MQAGLTGFPGSVISFFSIIALGFFLGMRHATDPDHVIAVSTIVSQQRNIRWAALIGAFWGIGHTLTVFAVGACIILFDLVIPPRLGLSMELSVAVMLIVLGVVNLASFLRSVPSRQSRTADGDAIVHSHFHTHGDYVHSHPHGHDPETHPHSSGQTPLARLDTALGKIRFYQPIRPFLIGVVHGLAGSAAVALLVLTTIRNSYWAVGYLLIFGVGTIVGMMLITIGIASTVWLIGGAPPWSSRLRMASGLISLVFGLVLVYQICLVEGLFSSSPAWTPH
jgi:ABC-type nickel/cobalt efflux system permease component RcnA